LIRDFNLLATTDVYSRSEGCSELWMLLRAVGDEEPTVDRSPVKGLVAARTALDPIEAVGRLRGELRERPEFFRVLLRVIPVERVVQTSLDEIVEAAGALAERISDDESYRITLEKRRTGLRSREVIDAVAGVIDRRVDLEEPDWVVLIEVVGKLTGVSVIRPEGLLNVQKERSRLPPDG
jgi:tRNA acetyltransferase TAN1